MGKDHMLAEILENFNKNLPEVVSRKQLAKELGGLISHRGLANLDCEGKGPGRKVKIGRTVGYPKSVVLLWLSLNLKFD